MKINNEYQNIVNNILNNEKFLILKEDNHHGTNKYDHCKRVSYLSFFVAKIFKANYTETARAGLLHDFFYGSRTSKEENSYLKHPLTSAKNASENFTLDKNEIDIIKTHMYHYALFKKLISFPTKEEKEYLKKYKPKNKEGIIVCISDLFVSIYEVFAFKIRYSFTLYFLFLINIFNC